MVMAAARLDMPVVIVSGGPMLAGYHRGRRIENKDVLEGVGAYFAGKMTAEELDDLERGLLSHVRVVRRSLHGQLHELPHRGSRPGSARRRHHPGRVLGAAHAGAAHRRPGGRGGAPRLERETLPDSGRPAERAGARRGARLLHQHGAASHRHRPRGGAGPASAAPSTRCPHGRPTWSSCRLPARCYMEDFHRAGGVMAALAPPRRGRAGRRRRADGLGQPTWPASTRRPRPPTTRSSDRSTAPTAPRAGWPCCSAIWRPTAPWSRRRRCCRRCCVHRGPARVFDDEASAVTAIAAGDIEPGCVVVIRYVGPKGGAGHARDAHAHLDAGGGRSGRPGGARHRRALQRRHPGSLRRARGARGRGRGAHRPRARRRPHLDRYPGKANSFSRSGGGAGCSTKRRGEAPDARSTVVLARYVAMVSGADKGAVLRAP